MKCRWLMTMWFVLVCGVLVAQNKVTVSGVVIDDTGATIPGVSVTEAGTTNGTITDMDGQYNIIVNNESSVLTFSFIGFASQRVEVGSQTTLNITLIADVVNLDEVVAVGYGTMKKSDLTGAVVSVKSEELEKQPLTTIEQGLQGRASGVMVTQTDAAPGGGMSVQIRGTNSLLGGNEPLYVVDGVPLWTDNASSDGGSIGTEGGATQTMNVMSTINPNDIESIEILKDAAATAIYGARASNGVVLISTKSGKSGQAKVTFNSQFAMSQLRNKIDVLDPITYANYRNEAALYAGGEPMYGDTASTADPIASHPFPLAGEGTDWQDEIYEDAYSQEYGLSISGGTDKLTYSFSLGHLDQDGVIIGSNFTRNSVRANIEGQVSERLKFSTRNFISDSKNRFVMTSTTSSGIAGGVVRNALRYNPVIEKDDYDPMADPDDDLFGANPYVTAVDPRNEISSLQVMTSNYLEYELSKGLKLRGSAAMNILQRRKDQYEPSTTWLGMNKNGMGYIGTTSRKTFSTDAQIRYWKRFNDHVFNIVGVTSYEQSKILTHNSEASNFINDNLENHALQLGDPATYMVYSSTAEQELLSFIGRLNYSLKDRYLLQFTMRADQSSKFSRGHKWGYFPSTSVGWRISEEGFMEGADWLTNLKLRTSYGQTGNSSIPTNTTYAQLGSANAPIGDVLQPGLADTNLGNDNTKWETTTTYNIGLDAGFLNRFNFTADVYKKTTEDMLRNVPMPPNTGFTGQLLNMGTMENRGIELQLNALLISKSDFKWDVTANWSMNRNEIINLGEDFEQEILGRLGAGGMNYSPFIWLEGQPIGLIYGLKVDGVYEDAQALVEGPLAPGNHSVGEYRYVDYSGAEGEADGMISEDYDRVVIGDVNPDWIAGLTTNFSYKSWDLSLFFQAVIGNDVINQNLTQIASMNENLNQTVNAYQNRSVYELDADGAVALYSYDEASGSLIADPNGDPRLATVGAYPVVGVRNLPFSDKFIEDGSYLRLKNLRLAYNLPAIKINWLSSGQVFFTATNLWTLTDYTGYDPEVSAFGQSPARRGVDAGSYPSTRTYTVGVKLTF